jgi:SNF2 family DNA or RNA helicase
MEKTFGKISYNTEHSRWELTEVLPHVCIKLKAIFPKIPKTGSEPFVLADLPETCIEMMWFMERYPLRSSDADMKRLKAGKKEHISFVNELEKIMMPDYIPVDMHLKAGEKRDYQISGKDLYMKARRLLLGDDIGLGKTVVAILSMLHKETLPCCVVVQTHLPKQWQSKVQEFTDLRVHIIKGTKPYNLPEADVYITSYSKLAGWIDVFKTSFFKSAVFDEIQELRIAGSQKYQGGMALSESVEYCLGMSASPVYNYGDEIYHVLNLIKRGCLGFFNDFQREWCNYGRKVENPQALGTYLRDNFLMLRRTRKDVGKELPPINKIIHVVEHDEDEMSKVSDLARALAVKVTSGTFMERGMAGRELDLLLRQATGVSKAKGVAAYVKILLENNVPVVLAGWHRAVYDIWNRELAEYNPVMYTGTESPAQKEKAREDFISGKTNLFIISLRSGVGLDGLQQRCSTVAIGELDYSPKVHDQLIGRLDREGQASDESVTAIFLVSEDGSDPPIIDLLGIKASQAHGINDPLDAMPDQVSDDSRIKMMAELYLSKNN